MGPKFGYFPNAGKTWLVVKPEHLKAAESHFQGTGVMITARGQRHLGSAVGVKTFVEEFVVEKVMGWVKEVEKLSTIARFQPQAAHVVFTHGLTHRWNFLMRTIPGVEDLLQPLEEVIRHQFLPALTGRQAFSDAERELIALPAHLGGLGIPIPARSANQQHESCAQATAPLVDLIISRSREYPKGVQQEERQVKAIIRSRHKEAEAVKHNLLVVSGMQWSRQVREVHRHGSQLSL